MDDIRPPKPRQPIKLPSPNRQQPTPDRVTAPETETPKPVIAALQPKLLAQKTSKKHHVLISIVIILALLISGVVYSIWWYNNALQPRSTSQTRLRVTVEAGATMQHIAEELERKEIIKSALALQIYVKQQNKEHVQAGTYLFSPTQPIAEIVSWLNDGHTDIYQVTILPGKTLTDIKQALIKDGFESSAVDRAFAKNYDHPLLKSKPAGVSLEGYIFPDTYEITSETSVEALLVKTFDTLYDRIQAANIEPTLAARNMTIHQGLTLASIVQLEVSNSDDRRQVAQVFEKRLSIGMPLGSDVTFFYAAKLLGQPASVSIDSPYNTRRYNGLPPGAIANFNFAALEAVANPAPGDYLYFVAGDDGKTHFSTTLEGHEQNVQNYCTTLCN